jgi:hypothetical protein
MDHIRVAIEIELHPSNMNREDVFCLRKSYPPWKIRAALLNKIL